MLDCMFNVVLYQVSQKHNSQNWKKALGSCFRGTWIDVPFYFIYLDILVYQILYSIFVSSSMQRHSQKQILERYFSNNVMWGWENSVKNPKLQVQKYFTILNAFLVFWHNFPGHYCTVNMKKYLW